MLVNNNYLKYDMNLEEYYLTVDAVINYTEFDSDDLGKIYGDIQKSLKVISHSIYRLIDSFYKGQEPYHHKKFMRMMIYDNTQGEVNSLMMAMLEAVKGSVTSGLDLNPYISDPKTTFPSTVYEELQSGMLLNGSRKIALDYTISYTSEELAKWSE